MSTLEGFSDNAFIEKPASGWLHEDRDLIGGNSITYSIQVGWVAPAGWATEGVPLTVQFTRPLRSAVCRCGVRAGVHQQLEEGNPYGADPVGTSGHAVRDLWLHALIRTRCARMPHISHRPLWQYLVLDHTCLKLSVQWPTMEPASELCASLYCVCVRHAIMVTGAHSCRVPLCCCILREAIVRLADHAQIIQANKKRKVCVCLCVLSAPVTVLG